MVKKRKKDEGIVKYLTPLGVITQNDTEDTLKGFFGPPQEEVSSGNAKSMVYYAGTIRINIVLLKNKVKGVVVEETDIRRRLKYGDKGW